MIGPAKAPRLKAKAAETRLLLELCPALLDENPDCWGENGRQLKDSVDALISVYRIMKTEDRRMTQSGLRELREAMMRHLFCGGLLVAN